MVLGLEHRSNIPIPDIAALSSMATQFHPTGASGGAHSLGRSCSSPGCGNGPQRTCSHCGRHNNTIDTCFMKHDYPPGYNFKSSKPSLNNATESSDSSLIP